MENFIEDDNQAKMIARFEALSDVGNIVVHQSDKDVCIWIHRNQYQKIKFGPILPNGVVLQLEVNLEEKIFTASPPGYELKDVRSLLNREAVEIFVPVDESYELACAEDCVSLGFYPIPEHSDDVHDKWKFPWMWFKIPIQMEKEFAYIEP
jgi:hypothetical protein